MQGQVLARRRDRLFFAGEGTRHRMPLVIISVSILVVATTSPVSAATTTVVAPYSSSSTQQFCDEGATCTTTVGADHLAGTLATDVGVVGSKGWWFYCWPFCTIGTYNKGGGATAILGSTHHLSKPATSVTFTVVVHTGRSTAETIVMPDGCGAWCSYAEVKLDAYARHAGCSCYGWAPDVVLASSTSQPSSDPATRSVVVKVARSDGTKLPAGSISLSVRMRALGIGPDHTRAVSSATVKSISWLAEV